MLRTYDDGTDAIPDGVAVLIRVITRRRNDAAETDDAAELARVERLLAADKDRKA